MESIFLITFILYFVSSIFYIIYIVFNKRVYEKVGFILLIIGFLFNTVGLIYRYYLSSHLPLTNLYETLLLLSFLIVLVFIIINKRYNLEYLGIGVGPIGFIIIGFASLLPPEAKAIQPLVPALKSGWLKFHVFTCIAGYTGFAISFANSVVFFIKNKVKALNETLKDEKRFNKITYNSILIGFIFLSIGIVTGAIWANYTWGRFWGWDIKETWALITWIVYLIFLHIHFIEKSDFTVHWVSIIGFIIVIFTYIGLNLFGSGLHSYSGF